MEINDRSLGQLLREAGKKALNDMRRDIPTVIGAAAVLFPLGAAAKLDNTDYWLFFIGAQITIWKWVQVVRAAKAPTNFNITTTLKVPDDVDANEILELAASIKTKVEAQTQAEIEK